MTDDASGVEAWKEDTTAFDRVKSVAETISRPHTASWIADEAAVSEQTTREYLNRLAEIGILSKDTREGSIRYGPNPSHTRERAIRELHDEYDHSGLSQLQEELQQQIESLESDERAILIYRLGIVEDALSCKSEKKNN